MQAGAPDARVALSEGRDCGWLRQKERRRLAQSREGGGSGARCVTRRGHRAEPREPVDVFRRELVSDCRLQPGFTKAAQIVVEVTQRGAETIASIPSAVARSIRVAEALSPAVSLSRRT